MSKLYFSVLLKVLYLSFLLFIFGCGPSAREREAQRKEDSLRLDQERIDLLERTGRMLDSVKAAPEDGPK